MPMTCFTPSSTWIDAASGTFTLRSHSEVHLKQVLILMQLTLPVSVNFAHFSETLCADSKVRRVITPVSSL